ncbi:MAG: hypothetical protein SFW09_00725 [Hyphomicrobiaceae bacterium]|nr:hypothetical protein [Hyphomicrobiaceae bacterium]
MGLGDSGLDIGRRTGLDCRIVENFQLERAAADASQAVDAILLALGQCGDRRQLARIEANVCPMARKQCDRQWRLCGLGTRLGVSRLQEVDADPSDCEHQSGKEANGSMAKLSHALHSR